MLRRDIVGNEIVFIYHPRLIADDLVDRRHMQRDHRVGYPGPHSDIESLPPGNVTLR